MFEGMLGGFTLAAYSAPGGLPGHGMRRACALPAVSPIAGPTLDQSHASVIPAPRCCQGRQPSARLVERGAGPAGAGVAGPAAMATVHPVPPHPG